MKRKFRLGLPVAGSILLAFWLPVFGQSVIVDDDCMACHDDYDSSLSGSSHQLTGEASQSRIRVGCVSCHDASPDHLEEPTPENITVPAKLDSETEAKLCRSCHSAHVELDNYGYDVHQDSEFNCSSCHQIHNSNTEMPLVAGVKKCLSCHEEKVSDFSRRSNHPLLQENLTCLSCHQFTRRQDSPVSYDINRVCQDCHPEQSGPFPFEHEAVNGYAVEGAGCIECHEPHGSENDRLLKQPPTQICQQCHITPMLHDTKHGGVARNRTCQTCHTGMHGSLISSHFLDIDMPAIISNGLSCYDSGCHELNR